MTALYEIVPRGAPGNVDALPYQGGAVRPVAARQILALARDARGPDRFGHRAEFLRLVELSALLRR